MGYPNKIIHPDFGEILNLKEAAQLLGISQRMFRRIAPGPDYKASGICPYWARRVLGILPVQREDFDQGEVQRLGRECAQSLVGELEDDQITDLRRRLGDCRGHTLGEDMSGILLEMGIKVTFRFPHEAHVYREGVCSVFRNEMERRHPPIHELAVASSSSRNGEFQFYWVKRGWIVAFEDHFSTYHEEWLCIRGDSLVGRITESGPGWSADLEGDMPEFKNIGQYQNRKAAQEAIERAVRVEWPL